jgi:hypothetical protein
MTKIRERILQADLVRQWILPKIIKCWRMIAQDKKRLRQLERREAKVKELEQKLPPMIEKLTAVVFSRERDIGVYRLMLTFDTHFVDHCLWGNDQWIINRYSEEIGHRVAIEVDRELRTMNFARHRKVY